MTKFTEFNVSDFLIDDQIRKDYLNEVLKDGDFEELKRALFYIAKSKGIENVAKLSGLNRESIYKIFKPNSKPRFDTIFKILNALDLNLQCA